MNHRGTEDTEENQKNLFFFFPLCPLCLCGESTWSKWAICRPGIRLSRPYVGRAARASVISASGISSNEA